MIKSIIKKAFDRLGYQVCRRKPDNPQERPQENPFLEMRRLVQAANPIIFDVGAHHGHISLNYRRLFPTATVYAFEPFPESYAILKKNTSADPMIKAFNFGFSDVAGPKLFSSNTSSATNSLFESDDRGTGIWGEGLLETSRRITANFVTIDRFIAEGNIPTIDILKLDVQGAEYLVLKGAEQSIAASRIGLVYSEIITQPTYKNQKQLHEMLGIFHHYGFELHNIFELSTTKDGRLRQIDAIFTMKPAGLTGTIAQAEVDLTRRWSSAT
jgi:FkbM family methyltransferase